MTKKEEHRRRLQNFADAYAAVEICMRHHFIKDHFPSSIIFTSAVASWAGVAFIPSQYPESA